ncbi:MAG: peptidase M48, partial [Actinomycetota bacterium]
MFAFLLSATAIAPLSIGAQTTDTQTKQDDRKDKKDNKKQEKQTTAPQTDGSKTLAVNEDPSMIGKRNINSGGDKFWGWLGGSKEKEMQVGRQLALEVEQQAKLVDDEMVTEYINRIGQNIVLHSDAKVPFTIKVIDTDEVNAFALPGGFFYVNKGLI